MKQVTMESVKERISELTTTGIVSLREDFELACLRELVAVTEQRDAVVTENHLSRNAVQTFCDVVGGNTDAICEEVGEEGVRAILAAMKATGNMSATDAAIAALRAEGVEMAASERWGSGYVFDELNEFARQLRESRGAQG